MKLGRESVDCETRTSIIGEFEHLRLEARDIVGKNNDYQSLKLLQITKIAQRTNQNDPNTKAAAQSRVVINQSGDNSSKTGHLRQRARSSRNHSDQDDDEREGRKKRKVGIEKRLKCPFYLWRPDKHKRGSCRGEGFADMGKLKDHLKRVHQKPRQCPRCWNEVPTEDAHEKLDPPCPKRPEPEDDRVSADTLRELNFSRVPYANRTVEEKWRRLYKDLFPDEKDIPSPYDEYGLGPNFDRKLAQKLEEVFRREFAELIQHIGEERLHERLLQIIRECRNSGAEAGFEASSSSRVGSVASSEADVREPPVARSNEVSKSDTGL